jgi:DNA-3-methyladenine glycosylase II
MEKNLPLLDIMCRKLIVKVMMTGGEPSLALKASHHMPVSEIVFQLQPVPPFRLDLTVWGLRRRPHNLVDRWDGQTYRRVLPVSDQPVEVAVTQIGPAESPRLRVEASNSQPHWEWASMLTSHLVKMLGLSADLAPFYHLAAQDERLQPLAERWRGFKPPQFPTLFESLVNAIACQQLSLTMGIHLLNRLATAYGPSLPGKEEPRPAFPRPADLADLEPDDLRALGFSRNKSIALLELARSFRDASGHLENLDSLEKSEVMNRLLALRGIGRWSAEYVLLRGLGRWSVFPGDDVGARRRLETWLQPGEPLNYQEVRRRLAPWQPFAGLIYFHLLLSHLAEEGRFS